MAKVIVIEDSELAKLVGNKNVSGLGLSGTLGCSEFNQLGISPDYFGFNSVVSMEDRISLGELSKELNKIQSTVTFDENALGTITVKQICLNGKGIIPEGLRSKIAESDFRIAVHNAVSQAVTKKYCADKKVQLLVIGN